MGLLADFAKDAIATREAVRQLDRIATALEQIVAVHAPRTETLTPAEEPPPLIAREDAIDPALVFQVEEKLREDLGRTPTADEICAIVDAIPPGEFPRWTREG